MDAIPARLRKALYVTLFLAGVVVGALNIADVSTGKAVDVIAYLGTALGLVAAGNVKSSTLRVDLADSKALLAKSADLSAQLQRVSDLMEANPKATGAEVAKAINGTVTKAKGKA